MTASNCACALVLFKVSGQTTRYATTKKKRATDTETAEPPSLYLWQVGQSRLQSKVLSFPQLPFSAGLGEVLFHSMTAQCRIELY